MNALPSLNGAVGYIFTSCDLALGCSRDVRFKDMVDRFRVYDQPRRPEGKPEEWLAGERMDSRGEHTHMLSPWLVPKVKEHRLPAVRLSVYPYRTP